MRNNFKGQTAFSLIEISIVLLIIGILIAGVTQSSRLVAKSRYNNARALTQSSPVASIKNLILWLETTSENSFADAETESDSAVTNFYDINPQFAVKSNFSASSTARPTYKTSSTTTINSLPTLSFDGSNDAMSTTGFPLLRDQSSVFFVVKTPATIVADKPIFSNRPTSGATSINLQVNIGSTSTGWQYCDNASGGCVSGTGTTAANKAYVVSMTYVSLTADGIYMYQNGSNISPTTGYTTGSPDTTSGNTTYIGRDGLSSGTAYFTGYLGELIIFDRTLKDEERQAIEAYLGQKWGVIMAVSS